MWLQPLFTKLHFLSLSNGSNRLECLSLASLSSPLSRNTLAYMVYWVWMQHLIIAILVVVRLVAVLVSVDNFVRLESFSAPLFLHLQCDAENHLRAKLELVRQRFQRRHSVGATLEYILQNILFLITNERGKLNYLSVPDKPFQSSLNCTSTATTCLSAVPFRHSPQGQAPCFSSDIRRNGFPGTDS